MWAKHIGLFERFFEGAKSFLIIKCPKRRERAILGSKRLDPLEKTRVVADYVFCQETKNKITNF